MRWHQTAKTRSRFFYDGRRTAICRAGETAHSFSIRNRLVPTFGMKMANLLTTSLTIRSIWGERLLRRRGSGDLDPLLAGRFSPSFSEMFVLTTMDTTCYSRARRHLELSLENPP